MDSSQKFDVEFLDLSGLINDECFQLLHIIDENESPVSKEELLKEENECNVHGISLESSDPPMSADNEQSSSKPDYERNQRQVEERYNVEVQPESMLHPSYAKASDCVTTASDFNAPQSHPIPCNQPPSAEFSSPSFPHGSVHGMPAGAQHYTHPHSIPCTQPNVANSGPPPNIYSHVPQAHMIPPTVYVEHCHVNVGSPYGAHQPPPNMYVPHQSYPNPYGQFMMNDLASSAPMTHGPGNYEKEQEYRGSRGSYRSRGRGQGRGKRIHERSNSVSSDHSSYSDAGRTPYGNTPPPPPPHAVPNSHYPPRYANHGGYMYASSVPMMHQSQHYVPGHYTNPNIIYNQHIAPAPQSVTTFEQTCDTSAVQVSEESSRMSGYVMQTVQVTSASHMVCGGYESSPVIYTGKVTESLTSESYPIEEPAHVEENSYDASYVNGGDPAFFDQPEESFHVVQNSGDSYSHSYASSDSDRPLTDYSGGHSPIVEVATEIIDEDATPYGYHNYVSSEHTQTSISAGTNVSSPCFVPNLKAHPISDPISSIANIEENIVPQADNQSGNFNYFGNSSDFDFMSGGQNFENDVISEKIILPSPVLKQIVKKVESKPKTKKPAARESLSPPLSKKFNQSSNTPRVIESIPKSPKAVIDQKVTSKKLNPVEPKIVGKVESKASNVVDFPVDSGNKEMRESGEEGRKIINLPNKSGEKIVYTAENRRVVEDPPPRVDVSRPAKQLTAPSIPVWNGNKSWAQILVKPNEISNKQVAFVHPFNANETHDEVLSTDVVKEDKVRAALDGDEVKIKIGGLLSKHAPDYKPILLQPRGLINKNYWCYVNAPLQALLACPSIYKLMKTLAKEAGTGSGNTSTPFINSFVDLVNNFGPLDSMPKVSKKDKVNKKEPQIVTSSPFEPNVIYRMLINSKKNQFTEGRQQDAEEMLSFVLNGLHDEMVESRKLFGPPDGEENEEEVSIMENDAADDENEWKVQGPKKKSCITRSVHLDKSPISDIFWGTFRSVLQKGGITSAHLQPFNTIPLDIQSPKVDTLKEALGQLVAKEEISGLACSKTNKEISGSNQVVIETLPRVLILHLKRFIYDNEGGLQKVDKKLDFPIDLDITRDLISQISRGKYNSSQRRYKLIAVVSHEGKEATKGHYIADVHHPGYNCWIRYDDSNVKVISEAILQKHDPPRVPYLLFYRRCDTTQSNKSNGPVPNKDTK